MIISLIIFVAVGDNSTATAETDVIIIASSNIWEIIVITT